MKIGDIEEVRTLVKSRQDLKDFIDYAKPVDSCEPIHLSHGGYKFFITAGRLTIAMEEQLTVVEARLGQLGIEL